MVNHNIKITLTPQVIFYKNYLIVAPKGIKASLAILKCCKPKGIPIIVIQKIIPNTAETIAIGIPVTIIHIIFRIKEPAPPPYTISFPKGKKLRLANLKHCKPIGIPIIVIHHKQPASIQLSPLKKPPNINQIKLPKHPIPLPPSYIMFFYLW